MSFEHIKRLSLNPYMMSKIIQSFLEGYSSAVDVKILFYVLPIVLNKDSRDRLLDARSTSKIDSLFGKKGNNNDYENLKLSGKSNLVGFLERFNELKVLTKESIIVLVNEDKIKISNSVILLKKDNYSNYSNKNIKETLKAGFYLGVIFKKSSIEHLDNYLGVKSS
nr:three component ABC system middle component [Brevibacillus laterosporus]